jgi:hypothetical protein
VAIFVKKKVHVVDSAPALALVNEYLSDMQQGKPDDAFGLYAGKFRDQAGEDWKGFLEKMPEAFGPVSSYSVESGHVVPVESKGCYSLRYDVQRTLVSSSEGFVVCPTNGSKWEIVGHDLTRKDTGQHVAAGIVPIEVEVP